MRLFFLMMAATWLVIYINCESNLCKMTSPSKDRELVSLPGRKGRLLCDTESDGGGWVVIQRRVTGHVKFSNKWAKYASGFGSIEGDFWLGLENIHQLCETNCSLRIDFFHKGKWYFLQHEGYTLSGEDDQYKMTLRELVKNNTVDDMHGGTPLFPYFENSPHNMKFSTIDRDNDLHRGSCSSVLGGGAGWWWNACGLVNLNGKWNTFDEGLFVWSVTYGRQESVSFSEIKVRTGPGANFSRLDTSAIDPTAVCSNTTFGLNCSKLCHCQDICDQENGSCPSYCKNGWRGVDCQQECPNGTFGLNCSKLCHCQDICDKGNGSCPTYCENGWRGVACQQDDSTYDPCGIHTCQVCGGVNFNCSCLHGYENLNPQVCVDIDECDQYGVCGNHTCRNEEGGYECICSNGSYENIAHEICVKPIAIDPETVIVEYFFPTEIEVRVVIFVLSANIIAFLAIVAYGCAFTVFNAVRRFVTTEPFDRRQTLSFGHGVSGQFDSISHVMIISQLVSEGNSSVTDIEGDMNSFDSETTISVKEIEKELISFKSEDMISTNKIERDSISVMSEGTSV